MRTRRNKRKMFTWVLVLVLITISLFGCKTQEREGTVKTNGQTKDKTKEQAMGRYMEDTIALPELGSEEEIVKIVQNQEKQFEVYSASVKGQKIQYLCYKMRPDGTWESSEPAWLKNTEQNSGNSVLTDLCVGGDGNYYATFENYDDSVKSHIIMSEDGGKTSINADIPYLSEEMKKIEGNIYYPRITYFDVLRNGNFVLYDLWNDTSLFVFSKQGEKIDELKFSMEDNFTIDGNDIILKNEEGTGIMIYNTETKSVEKTIDYTFSSSSGAYAIKEDGTILLGDSNGIHRYTKDGTLWETTVDGSLNSMNMPTLSLKKLYAVDQEIEEYYAVYQDSQRGLQLKHYAFDKTVSTLPQYEITVYSLNENSTIRQAISLFQSQNDDIKVNYVVAMGEEGGNVSDYIRALNTELLAGNGADILVLDGLPVDSYVEKGVLADITDVIEPLNDNLLTNITDYYTKDTSIYQMPIRFSVPVIIGEKDALSSVKSLNDIADYISKSGNTTYMTAKSYKSLLADNLALYSDDLFQTGSISEDHLIGFLENVKIIGDNIKAAETVPSEEMRTNAQEFMPDNHGLFQGSVVSLVSGQYQTVQTQIKSMYDSVMLYAILNDRNLDYTSINNMFLPNGVIGLNKASKESEIAKKFIQFLYTDQVQSANINDGFPVIQTAMKDWIYEENGDYSVAISDQNGNMITGDWPVKEDRDELYQKLLTSVTKPIRNDQILDNMIMEESLPFFMGEKDASQVAASIKTKVNTYLLE